MKFVVKFHKQSADWYISIISKFSPWDCDMTKIFLFTILSWIKTISFFAPAFWRHWKMFEIVILILELSQTLPLQTPRIIGLDHNIVSSRHNFRRLLWKIKIFISNMMVLWNDQVNFIFCFDTMGTLLRFKAFKVHHDFYSEISLAITWLIHLNYLQIITTGLWYNKPILVRNFILNKSDIVFFTDILGTLN